ncbi:MAG TPA: tRNA pseudouridine(13) synthase TruD [Leucothrix mucor]|nr:tRNA pseudouridine(13) synthase TruD [Leucothrix mucor]
MNRFAKAFSNDTGKQLRGTIRNKASDFKVDEISSFELSGEGEHAYLHIEKTGENTDWVAGLLAKIAEVPRKDVSYAGMKDRHAITTQWFSVQIPGREAPNWQEQLPDTIRVLAETRHDKKLRRGALKGNRFTLIIRDIEGDIEQAKNLCQKIKENGVPNYYGEQRFGRNFNNIESAKNWFSGQFKPKSRPKRSIYLSAARSWIFNHLLSQRVKQGTWNQALSGDVFMLNGSHSCFPDDGDTTLQERTQRQELHPTGALWGKGDLSSKGDVAILEQQTADELEGLAQGLIKHGLKQERRALRLNVGGFEYNFETNKITLSFVLPAGSFATVVFRELGDISSTP